MIVRDLTELGTTSRRKSVLIVDDNDDNLYLAKAVLERLGYEPMLADSGPAALELARTWRPDLVLMDLHMEDMDGFETTRRLRLDPALAGVPVIALTASYMRPGDREDVLRCGFDAYLVKPIAPATFGSDLERVLSAGPETA